MVISKIYEKVSTDSRLMQYLGVFEKNILNIKIYCDEIAEFIKTNLVLDAAKDIDQLQNFENNFIERNVDSELDKKTDTLKESEIRSNS